MRHRPLPILVALTTALGLLASDAAAGEASPGTREQASARVKAAEAAIDAEVEAMGPWRLAYLGAERLSRWAGYRKNLPLQAARVAESGDAEDDGPMVASLRTSPAYLSLRAELAEAHLAIVRGLTRAEPPRDTPFAGRWLDGFRGELRTVQHEDGLLFVIDVVRGPTHHLGTLAGRASLNHPLAQFTDAGHDAPKPEGGPDTWLHFTHRGSSIDVAGANTGYYHGARAYFDGRYFRVGDLSVAEAAEVTAAATGEAPMTH